MQLPSQLYYRNNPKYWDTLSTYHTSKIWNSPFYYISMYLKYYCMYGKQCRPKSHGAFCGIWSGSTLFAKVSVRILRVITIKSVIPPEKTCGSLYVTVLCVRMLCVLCLWLVTSVFWLLNVMFCILRFLFVTSFDMCVLTITFCHLKGAIKDIKESEMKQETENSVRCHFSFLYAALNQNKWSHIDFSKKKKKL